VIHAKESVVMQVNCDPAFTVQTLAAATSAFMASHLRRERWLVVLIGVSFASCFSIVWRSFTPMLGFIWERSFRAPLLDVIMFRRWGAVSLVGLAGFWLFPTFAAYVVAATCAKFGLPNGRFSWRSWIVLGIAVTLIVASIAWAIYGSGNMPLW
jgi:hypothetical protein